MFNSEHGEGTFVKRQLGPKRPVPLAASIRTIYNLKFRLTTFISQPEVWSENTPAYLEDFVGILVLLLSYFIYSRALDMTLSLTFWSLSIYVRVGFLCETISLLRGCSVAKLQIRSELKVRQKRTRSSLIRYAFVAL